MTHNPDDYEIDQEDDEYLTRVVIDVPARAFYLYSSEGNTRRVEENTVDEFMTLFTLIHDIVDEKIIAYNELIPLTKSEL